MSHRILILASVLTILALLLGAFAQPVEAKGKQPPKPPMTTPGWLACLRSTDRGAAPRPSWYPVRITGPSPVLLPRTGK